jgi:PhoH-like ATPase
MAKKTYVLDTSACLTDADCIYSYGNNDVVIPLKVLEEIDKHKKRQDSVGVNARKIIRSFDELRDKGSLQKGVRLGRGKGILKVRGTSIDDRLLPHDLDPTVADHVIIATVLSEDIENGNRKTIAVSRDINMRVICDAIGIQSEDYKENQIIKEESELYSGFGKVLVDDQFIDQFYADEYVYLDEEQSKRLHVNQFIMLVSNLTEKKTALCRYTSHMKPLQKITEYKDGLWGIRPRNKEQLFAINLLMDPEIKIVSLIGKAGSGKTLIAIAAGLEQVVSNPSIKEMAKTFWAPEGIYKKLVVSRPVMPMGKDIGFLPGSMMEKMAPWLAPVQDNLKFLTGDDQTTLDQYLGNGLIEMEALTYIRGRSISNAYIIIDEAQNLTSHEIKTILTRVGEGTKIVLTGDIEQIDNIYINEMSSGLTHAVERFKDHSIAGHVTLKKGERSDVASLAAKIL